MYVVVKVQILHRKYKYIYSENRSSHVLTHDGAWVIPKESLASAMHMHTHGIVVSRGNSGALSQHLRGVGELIHILSLVTLLFAEIPEMIMM